GIHGGLNGDKEATYIDVAPGGIAAQGARAPDADAATGESPDAVDADWVEHILFAFADRKLHTHSSGYHFVGGCLVDAAVIIGTIVDTRDMSARRYSLGAPGTAQICYDEPRIVQRSIRTVEVEKLAPFFGLLRIEMSRRIENCKAVLHQLA